MTVGLAGEQHAPGLLSPAAQVEQWSGPTVADAGFRTALEDRLRRSRALAATAAGGELSGGLLFGPGTRAYRVPGPVVGERARGTGVGHALVDDANRRWVRGPATGEAVTFGAGHPGASASGARASYERLGFVPARLPPRGRRRRAVPGRSSAGRSAEP
ncbi:GNAT family N-acetyltransferase [Streptomyces mayonensis]|uniref:GNAT family N-acetyltransferase n=1 Tax=Streptomyces mayonensis TaxID=2750816 RepID=UPI0020A6CF23|nr:GNAT family N-acetyltransferase [Streptomyces sp. A108]